MLTVDDAIGLLVEGRAIEVIEAFQSEGRPYDDSLRLTTLACAYSIVDRTEDAERILEGLKTENVSNTEMALRSTCQAYLMMHAGDLEAFELSMKEAIEQNPSIPLPWLSLGLFYQWKVGDFERAREMFTQALELTPGSHLVKRHLLGLEASDGNMKRARELLSTLLDPPTGRGLPWTLPVTLGLASTPLGGGLVVIVLIVLSFYQYVSAVLIPAWGLLSVASFRQLRRVSGRLALLPGLFFVALVAGLFLEWLITGSPFP